MDSKNRTVRTEVTEQDRQNGTSRRGQAELDWQNRTVIIVRPNRKGRIRQTQLGRQDWIGRTG
jgi:hypothetical protein